MEDELIVPQRMSNAVDGQPPLIMVGFRVKDFKRNKELHDLVLTDVENSPHPKTTKLHPITINTTATR